MARQARLFIPECPVVLELQGVGGQDVFKIREAFAFFRDRLPVSAREEGVQVHAYGLATVGAMVMLQVSDAQQAGRFVQNLNRHFSPVIKDAQPTSGGPVWEPRFKSTVVQPGSRSLKACLFVEQLALRVHQTLDLATYPWSSYAAHAGVVNEPWLADLPSYWALGNTPFERQSRYRQFSEQGFSERDQRELTECIHKGWLWSDDAFFQQVDPLANRAARPRPRGRPPKA